MLILIQASSENKKTVWLKHLAYIKRFIYSTWYKPYHEQGLYRLSKMIWHSPLPKYEYQRIQLSWVRNWASHF